MLNQVCADNHCARLDGAERTQPFGPDTVMWRVEGHTFAAYTRDGQGLSLRSNGSRDPATNGDDTALTSAHAGDRSATLAEPGWVIVPWDIPPDDLRRRIDESYRLVRRDWRMARASTD